ncbi:PRC-barrel domain-containing protein [Cognatilysobacter terrigena]|uniref:PRC-barrel domain-containing protein n=1 Tax=Cognatilysobacter terrigena TaxID=2488749 RepID=UPI001AACC92A|nr:PRC-barrel domain-containing protein [Lysobacter terrigena]
MSQLLLAAALALASVGNIQAQTVQLVVVDVKAVALGLQASKLIGMDVRNAKGEKIGTIDDLIIMPGVRVIAVLQVGGFLGLGGHLVAVPFDSLVMTAGGTRASLPGGTKEALRKLPEFQYKKK